MSTPFPRLRAAAIAVFVTCLWSSSWVIIRRGLDDEHLAPITFAGLRYGLAATVLVLWTCTGRRRVVHAVARTSLRQLLALGAVAYALTQGAQFVAIDAQPAATTNLLLAMTPLLVAFSSSALLAEPTTRGQRTGGAVIVAGAAIYFAGDLGATSVGMIAATVCLLANAGATLLGRSVNRASRDTAMAITAVSMSTGAVVLLATGLTIEGLPRLSWSAGAIIVWLAIVNTALAFTLWNQAQRVLTATEAAAINTMMAVQIPLLAWVFLDEPLGPAEVTGIGLVVAGVLTMQSPPVMRRGDSGQPNSPG